MSRPKRRVLLGWFVMTCFLLSLGIAIGRSQIWSTIIGNGLTIIGSGGNLKIDGVGIYWDRNCSIAVKSLDWGTLEPGSVRNITFYIRNEGNHVVTLFISADNWRPNNASNYMTLSWNYDTVTLNPEEIVETTFNLSVSSGVENMDEFSFDLIIGTSE